MLRKLHPRSVYDVFALLALIIAVGGYYGSTELSYVFAFTFFIVLMFIRPRGLFTP